MPNIVSAFKDLDCSSNVYWGTSAGRSHYFGDYFRGLAYAMSWPLVRDVPEIWHDWRLIADIVDRQRGHAISTRDKD